MSDATFASICISWSTHFFFFIFLGPRYRTPPEWLLTRPISNSRFFLRLILWPHSCGTLMNLHKIGIMAEEKSSNTSRALTNRCILMHSAHPFWSINVAPHFLRAQKFLMEPSPPKKALWKEDFFRSLNNVVRCPPTTMIHLIKNEWQDGWERSRPDSASVFFPKKSFRDLTPTIEGLWVPRKSFPHRRKRIECPKQSW